MSLTQADIAAAFNEEAGDASGLTTTPEITRWFNEGQARLLRYHEKSAALAWAAGDTTVPLPADFVSVSQLDYTLGVAHERFRLFGKQYIIDRSDGAWSAGTATLWYWAERPDVDAGNASTGTKQEDYACVYYALHRFFRKLASSRAFYKRYATLLGANAVTVGDLQNESDRLLQDFVDARSDLPPMQPSSFYTPR